jgi:pimeloyl-ACP methyl ester carboxylesterase
MPEIVHAALPWVRVDGRKIYAVGGSMGGHETLLLLGQYPKLLAGAVAFDSVTNFYRRYFDFARSPGGRRAQALAREEVGGTPRTNPRGYVLRSPTHWLSAVARSDVPLQLWWSEADRIVIDQAHQFRGLLSGAEEAAAARARRGRHRVVEPLLQDVRQRAAASSRAVAWPCLSDRPLGSLLHLTREALCFSAIRRLHRPAAARRKRRPLESQSLCASTLVAPKDVRATRGGALRQALPCEVEAAIERTYYCDGPAGPTVA